MSRQYPYIDWQTVNKERAGQTISLLLTNCQTISGKLLQATHCTVEMESAFGNILVVSTTQVLKVE